MTPSPPPKNWSSSFDISGGGGMWASNVLLVWSIFDLGGGGGMQYNHLVFQAQRRFCTLSLGGYFRL